MNRSWTPARLALLLALLAVAEWLRATGLSFGLPAVYNPDEVAIMSRALGFAKGDLNPHNFLYPTFYFYVLFAWVGGWFALSWMSGAVSSLSAFQTQFFLDPSGVYHAGRVLGVACGVATGLTWLLGAGWPGGGPAPAPPCAEVAPPVRTRLRKHDVPVEWRWSRRWWCCCVWRGRAPGGGRRAPTRLGPSSAGPCGWRYRSTIRDSDCRWRWRSRGAGRLRATGGRVRAGTPGHGGLGRV